jgi:hypothetical protein
LGVAEPKASPNVPPAPTAKPAPRQIGNRGQFKQTARDLILSLLKGKKTLTTRELGMAWKQAKRGGTVDNTLAKMVKAKQIKRTKVKGEKGSRYSGA